MTDRKIPEILSPAGTADALKAAVNAGCNAVYLGGNLYGARAFAGNFDEEELLWAIGYCHLFGVKVYMTVNTLLKDQEIERLPAYMKPYYEAGLDGAIIQDAGVLKVLRENFPGLKLHASTQMSVSSAYGAKFLKSLGVSRIVPARELSLKELCAIKEKADVEIETFVHGAMCYAYSGKCLFSGFFGGRSGNRGRCAQPCRQKYKVLREDGKKESPAKYPMSMKDMCTLNILPLLIDAGMDSFKIEGRMKNPSYVAATTNAYRKARDFYLELKEEADGTEKTWEILSPAKKEKYLRLAQELTRDMQDIYNRGGFYTGYYFTEKGPEMISEKRPNHTGLLVGTVKELKGPEVSVLLTEDVHAQDVLELVPSGVELTSGKNGSAGKILVLKGKELKKIKPGVRVYRTRNNVLLEKIRKEILLKEPSVRAYAAVEAKTGAPLRISVSSGPLQQGSEIRVSVSGAKIESARNQPTDPSRVAEKMQKTKGTGVELEVVCDMDENAFIPMGELNDLRREAVEAYKNALIGQYQRK